jgi:hypothetical protein
MNRRLGATALLGFAVSLVVNVASASRLDVSSRFPYIWILHVGMFVVCIPFVLVAHKEWGAKSSFAAIVSGFPLWARVVVVAAFAYAVVNVLLFAVLYNGNADILNGEYVLSSHGRVLAHLTEAQYHLHKAIEIRGFSALWLLFYLLPCLYFSFRRERPA